MNYTLTDLGNDIRDDVRVFCERELKEQTMSADRDHLWPEDIYTKTAEMGLSAIFVPDENGGLPLTMQEQAAIIEELAYCDAGIAVSYMTDYLALVPVRMFGTPALQQQCFDHLLAGGFGAFALTEDQAGSDISGLMTKAVKSGSEYVITGNKAFVTNGGNAAFYTVFAKTENGISAFVVDADAEGVTAGDAERKLGIRNSRTAEVSFDHVRVSEANLLGTEGDGKRIAQEALSRARSFCAAAAIGVARRALDIALSRVREREQFGAPLSERESIQMKLADMFMRAEAARACCIDALQKIEAEEDCLIASAAAKCMAADAAAFCADTALQIYGGYGYCEDYPAEKLYRDARIFQIFEGTGEILRELIGRALVREV